MQTTTCFFFRMEPGAKYKVKLRHINKIYTTTLQGWMIDDIQYKGAKSSVIATLKDEDMTGMATGQFRHPVELISVEHITDIEEAMEVQVGIFMTHLKIE